MQSLPKTFKSSSLQVFSTMLKYDCDCQYCSLLLYLQGDTNLILAVRVGNEDWIGSLINNNE